MVIILSISKCLGNGCGHNYSVSDKKYIYFANPTIPHYWNHTTCVSECPYWA